MTGFGGAEEDAHGVLVRVDIRAVNNRYFKVQGRFPEEITHLAGPAEAEIHKTVKRGTVNIMVRLDTPRGNAARQVDAALVGAYAALAKKLARAHGLTADISVAQILALPGVIPQPEEALAAEAARIEEAFNRALARALERLNVMRLKEGEALRAELLGRVTNASRLLDEIDAELPAALQALQTRFKERIDGLLKDKGLGIDPASLAREVALLAERADVTEEVERLRSHAVQMRDLLAAGGEAGRQLDFLTQEMLREVTTMGAKIGSHALAEKVIVLKVEIDRLKEQAQNIE
jgi:uncharacterized protein (TIGR00255 family)